MAMNMVGTPGITVGLVLSMSFMASSSTKRGMMTISAPCAQREVHDRRHGEHVEERQRRQHPLLPGDQVGAPRPRPAGS